LLDSLLQETLKHESVIGEKILKNLLLITRIKHSEK